MELHIKQPKAEAQLKELMFNTRYYDADKLVESADKAVLPFNQLNDIAVTIQAQIHASETIQDYGFHLCQALRRPQDYDIKISDIDTEKLLRYIWSIDSLCKQFGHELIQFMPIENKFDILPDSFLNTKEITTLVENNTQLTEEQHKKLGKYLLIALINVLENKLK